MTPEVDQLTAEKHGGSDQHFAHVKNFLHCVKSRTEPTASDVEAMHRATTTCHLANISYKVRRRVYWNPEEEPATGATTMTRSGSSAKTPRRTRICFASPASRGH